MLSHLCAKHIGFALLPGCHDADLVNMQAIFAFHPRNRYYFLGIVDSGSATPCQSGLDLVTTANLSGFRQQLDVLVIVGYDEEEEEEEEGSKSTSTERQSTITEILNEAAVISILKEAAVKAKQVIAVGEGVLALAKTGLLSDHRVICAPSNQLLQEQLRPLVGEIITDVDGGDDANTSDSSRSADTDNQNSRYHQNHQRMTIPTVCESGKFVTAGPCTGAIEAALLVLARLRGTFAASLAELGSEYVPTVRFANVDPVRPDDLPSRPPLRVGVLLTKGMFLPDVIGALRVFKALPHCRVIGVVLEETDVPAVLGPTVGAASAANVSVLADCPQLDVFVVGMTMPWVLCHSAIVEFVQNQAGGCKAMVGVCAGALLLGSAGLLEGARATTNFQMTPLLPAMGATTVAADTSEDEEKEDLVVVDDDEFIYTAGPIIGSYEAAILVVAKLYGKGVAAHIERNVLSSQHPHPPFNVGIARNASRGLLLAAKASVLPLNPIYRYCAQKGLAKTRQHQNGETGDEPKSSSKAIGIALGAGMVLAAALVVQRTFLSPRKIY